MFNTELNDKGQRDQNSKLFEQGRVKLFHGADPLSLKCAASRAIFSFSNKTPSISSDKYA